jgi:hypothetical protein
LKGWHPREIPNALLLNPALQKQQTYNLAPLDQWWLALLHNGKLPGAKPNAPWVALTRFLAEDAKRRVPRLRELSDVALCNYLTDAEAMGVKIIKKRTSAANGWEFPLLCDCRAAWEKRYGPTEWDTNIRDWGDEVEEEQPKPKPTVNADAKPEGEANVVAMQSPRTQMLSQAARALPFVAQYG